LKLISQREAGDEKHRQDEPAAFEHEVPIRQLIAPDVIRAARVS
jgi:hypothetical protein